MEQKFEHLKKENPEELLQYFDFIKSSVKDGSYFKDGLNWYFFRYVNPFCERTIFTFAALVASIVFYCLIQMIQGAFPLVEKDPIIIPAVDQSQYFPNLVPLKPHAKGPGSKNYDPEIVTVDEAIAKYLLSVYVKDREAYDYSKSEVEDVNNKFAHIRNTSSASQYREFQLFMSKDNPDSPIHNFGQKVSKSVEIESVKFLKEEPKDFSQKAKDFLTVKIPTEAEVRFSTTLKTADENGDIKTSKESYLAKIDFSFSGVSKESKNNNLDFLVNSYKLYKVQQ
ncbi:MAG: VirB8/TrbF family protein [Rickettsiales bacterium]|nr:VirB8/TrbF family protein [Rickettsiales bacterium]